MAHTTTLGVRRWGNCSVARATKSRFAEGFKRGLGPFSSLASCLCFRPKIAKTMRRNQGSNPRLRSGWSRTLPVNEGKLIVLNRSTLHLYSLYLALLSPHMFFSFLFIYISFISPLPRILPFFFFSFFLLSSLSSLLFFFYSFIFSFFSCIYFLLPFFFKKCFFMISCPI
jgi:hypothetical protein